MSELDLHTSEGRAAAFAAFRAQPYNRFLTKLRQRRADQIRELFANPETMTLERFNREIWQIGHQILLRGRPISDRIFEGTIGEARVGELDAALDAGELQVEGNTIWRPASSVYGPGLKEDASAKEEHIRRAFAILTDVKLAPSEKVERIDRLPGFGPGAANLLVMIAAPTAWALDNDQSRGALSRLGVPAGNPIEVQVSASQLKEALGADDFIELDLFFYQLNQLLKGQPTGPRIWWVNQGGSYTTRRRIASSRAFSSFAQVSSRVCVERWRRTKQRIPFDHASKRNAAKWSSLSLHLYAIRSGRRLG